ncbi:MAG TPA: AAA domain-containing protein [Bryobacteraceae bacterium]|nr:AAA domain-containing protein [Bryobacteraceae bacterium]
MASRRLAKKGFLADYSVEDTYLLRPDRARGRAGILRARDRQSREVIVKFWPRAKDVDDTDLEDIWRSEIRQLQRLAAVPRADDLFVHMLSSGKDAEGFYVILDPGQGSPLEVFLKSKKKPGLIAQVRQPRSRRVLWANARRLAEALELLHSQGAIHRNLDPWAIITSLTDEPDFRITGFEWSMRIATAADKQKKKLQPPRVENSFSFARDWRDLALLFALFLDIPSGALGDLKVLPSRVAEHASASEVRLLRAMLGLEKVDRLDGEFVCSRIDDIVDSISAEAAGKEAKICLSLRLGSDSRLAEAIRRASGDEIEISDEPQQIRFISDDLGKRPHLVAVKEPADLAPRYILLGQLLSYRLAPYRQPGSSEQGNWEFAYCERAELEAPPSFAVVGSTLLDAGSLELTRNPEASQSFPRRRGKVQRWDDYIQRTIPTSQRKTDLQRMHQSFALLLMLEMAYAAAEIFPVKIISKTPDPQSDLHVIHLVSRNDSDRAKLSDLLGLEAPAVRLAKMIDADEVREEGAWTLSEPGTLGDRSQTTTSWRFVGREEIEHLECLRFEGPSPPLELAEGFLAPAGMTGRIVQFKRRLKALSAFHEHAELLRMLVDPRRRIEDSQDPLDEKDDAFKNLDVSKQNALREILSTIPFFLLQGPPGVGKTYLVGDVVRRRFDDEPTTRILLSAQSNSAIDHLMNEVQSIFRSVDTDSRPLMVRARSVDDDESAGELEIDIQADRLLQSLADSSLVAESSPHIRDRIRTLADARVTAPGPRRTAPGSGLARRMSAELRAFEGIILRSANLVFATTNSYAVERLIEERGLFDWTIIEEAGKATGGELLSPLLLSHRRLMIGDHKQLPPFDVDKISKLLSSTAEVKEAILLVDDLISRYLKDPGIDEVFREVETGGDDFGKACADTLSILSLFETFVEKELARQKQKGKGRPIARRLTEQYRMHPAIARIVSRCFYDQELKTNQAKEKKFLSNHAPFISLDAKRLPELPVVFIDMPYAREEAPGGRSGDRAPPWSNPDEAAATIAALELLKARDEVVQPSLAVLSPYWQQVTTLRQRLARKLDTSCSHLQGFTPAIESNEFCGTVDSFQGGEADVVLVSLVRNNAHSTPAKALGFLRDNRRMNVLLSRAKWRLILIGSLSFYRNIVEIAAKLPDQDIGFLSKFLHALDTAVADREACVVPWAQLKGGS